LIHDVGNALAPENHSQVSATIIQPFSLDKVIGILQMHGPFQMSYYLDKLSLEKDGRDIYSEHKLFNAAVKFCQKWNQLPFVPECQKGTELF
jgi:predicted HD phosphohydrolase